MIFLISVLIQDVCHGELITFSMKTFLSKDAETPVLYTLSLHDALPISRIWSMIACVTRGCANPTWCTRSEEHTSELQSRPQLVCRLLLVKKIVYILTQSHF